ncbi:unnamed protein product [Adineta ricciae]|uniref:G-protein coupled receptors family 1 profile domain-containing protein n=1 Tax=Adineta ricciae TaxID=249248 RepID=A0A815S0C7_ADIRI|nr:unnamed protein product [Adineta ricciae]CAF1485550.1 unnamed protein product [Adineta ricciae]
MYSSQTTDEKFNMIGQRVMIIFGTLMCILGLIGNCLNIFIFTVWYRSRKSPNKFSNFNRSRNSLLYLLVSSFANLIIIIYPLSTRILFDGYQYHINEPHIFFFCKFRYYILHTFYLISLTTICMATFDRYLISSRNPHLRELNSTKKQTIVIIVFICLIIGLHNIPIVFYFNLSSDGECVIFSSAYSYYYLSIFRILLEGLIPILFLSLFGILTFKQLRILEKHNSNNHLNSDRQVARMLLLISITIIISSIPNCIEQVYQIVFIYDDRRHSSSFFLFHVISSILFYTNPVMSFYIFYISTPNFRHQLRCFIPHKKAVNYFVKQEDSSKSVPLT